MKRGSRVRSGFAALALLLALPAAAERAWVRGAPLNLRSGPGTNYRILGVLKPGDALEVRERGEEWTRVSTPDGKDGWIAAGYLDASAPPTLRVQELEQEVAQLREEIEGAGAEAARLRSSNEALSGSDAGQRAQIERLTRENTKLRAGERWAEWITGALILSTGMVLGAILSRLSVRRSRTRLRL